jgi:hypothetical protein
MNEYFPHYAQLFGIGVLWVSFHCSGMCGPLVATLVGARSIPDDESTGRLERWWTAARRVLAYQGGRALTYAALGAAAGLVGAAAEQVVNDVTRVAGLVLAVALLVAGILKLPGVAEKLGLDEASRASGAGTFLSTTLRRLKPILPDSKLARMAAMGFVMGFLPCMLMFWVLGLSAATASPLHGAAIMVLLVVMTTPVLIVAGSAPLMGHKTFRKLGEWLIPAAMMVSAVWLGMISAAANGWVEHYHVLFEIGGEKYTIMFW